MKNERFCDRFSQLVEYYGNGRNTIFANLIGVTESNVRSWLNSTLPKVDIIEEIARNCEGLSLDWLVLGEGSMLKNEPDSTTISGENTPTDSNNSIILSLIQQNGDLREEVGRLKAELERLKAGTGNALNVATA